MAKKNLVIVESPAKAKTLEKFLGRSFKVLACGGHVRDLPKKSLGVDIKKHFKPNYQIIKGKEKYVNLLKEEAKKAALVYLAPDPDREGEAIAWHLLELLGDVKAKRIEFNEITKDAVLSAIKKPRVIDMARVEAQQARRILDRIVGYKLSPLLWKKIRKGLSAGRVQSVAVRLICEREAAVDAFKPEEYWTIIAKLSRATGEEFQAKLFEKAGNKISIINEGQATEATEELRHGSFSVSRVEKKERERHPAPPFITSTLQQESSRRLGFSASRTMLIAQQLYEGVAVTGGERVGLITYMRTDSVRIAKEAVSEARSFIEKEFGREYVPEEPRAYKRKKQAQDNPMIFPFLSTSIYSD
jgi:DNA topoisomerase-1